MDVKLGKENEIIEFKESTAQLKNALIDISAILNKHGHGILYFGVFDNGEIKGTQIGKETLREVANEIRQHIYPTFYFEVKEIEIDDKSIIEINFKGNNQPYSAYEKYYLRFSDSSMSMRPNELTNFLINSTNNYSKWEETDSNESIDSIDNDVIKNYIKRANDAKRINYKYTNKKDILSKMGLLVNNGNLNNAGKYLFSNKTPIILKLAVFAGESKSTFILFNIFNGNIYECIEEAMHYVKSHIDFRVEFDDNIRRKEVPEIPLIALREIIVNAFAHASYNSGTDFEINIFKNRVTIYSPGHFPIGCKPEDFAYNSKEAIPLNPKISNVLYKDKTVEKYSTGFARCFSLLKENSVNYEYVDTDTGFRFTFFRSIGLSKGNKLNKKESDVYNAIKNKSGINTKQISKTTRIPFRTVQRIINVLKCHELITRIGSNKTGYYQTVK